MPRTLLTGIATLTLAMTRKFNCHCEGSESTKQSPGRVAKNVILNDSEESHRKTDRAYAFHFGRGIFRLRSI